MSIDEFLDFMPGRVDFYARTGRDAQGKPVFASTPTNPSPIPCKISMKNHLVRGKDGREVTARGRVTLGSTFLPNIEDKIVLPSSYTPVSPPMIDVNLSDDEAGPHHTVIEIG